MSAVGVEPSEPWIPPTGNPITDDHHRSRVTFAGRALIFKIKLAHLWDQGILGRRMKAKVSGSKIVTETPRHSHLEEDDLPRGDPKRRPA